MAWYMINCCINIICNHVCIGCINVNICYVWHNSLPKLLSLQTIWQHNTYTALLYSWDIAYTLFEFVVKKTQNSPCCGNYLIQRVCTECIPTSQQRSRKYFMSSTWLLNKEEVIMDKRTRRKTASPKAAAHVPSCNRVVNMAHLTW